MFSDFVQKTSPLQVCLLRRWELTELRIVLLPSAHPAELGAGAVGQGVERAPGNSHPSRALQRNQATLSSPRRSAAAGIQTISRPSKNQTGPKFKSLTHSLIRRVRAPESTKPDLPQARTGHVPEPQLQPAKQANSVEAPSSHGCSKG